MRGVYMYAVPGHTKDGKSKAQLTLDYVLSITIIITIVSSTLLLLSNYKESIVEKYEDATIKSIVADVSYTITSVYVLGHGSKILPERNMTAMVARGSVVLPASINRKFYSTEISSSDKLVCGRVISLNRCANIVGVPSDFNITGITADGAREIYIVYWRERNETSGIRDYILVG